MFALRNTNRILCLKLQEMIWGLLRTIRAHQKPETTSPALQRATRELAWLRLQKAYFLCTSIPQAQSLNPNSSPKPYNPKTQPTNAHTHTHTHTPSRMLAFARGVSVRVPQSKQRPRNLSKSNVEVGRTATIMVPGYHRIENIRLNIPQNDDVN